MLQDPFTDVVSTAPTEASTEVVARAQRRRFSAEYTCACAQVQANCASCRKPTGVRRENWARRYAAKGCTRHS